jgi:hypothetical protein
VKLIQIIAQISFTWKKLLSREILLRYFSVLFCFLCFIISVYTFESFSTHKKSEQEKQKKDDEKCGEAAAVEEVEGKQNCVMEMFFFAREMREFLKRFIEKQFKLTGIE